MRVRTGGTVSYVVAVDLGGTLTKIGRAAADGTIGDVRRVSSVRDDGGDVSVNWLAGMINDVIGTDPGGCVGYGVMVPGIIDSARQTVRAAPNTGWFDVPLGKLLDEATGQSGVIGHDVRAGGLAEWRLGSGFGVDNLLFLALGTGIAGAAVVDGRMLEAGGYAGELGHIRVTAASEHRCACGLFGCLETVASAAGIARSFHRTVGRTLDTREIAAWARAGDQAGLQAFAVANAALVEVLALYVGVAAPEVVVLGGGLVAAADLMVPALISGLDDRLSFHRRPRLVTASTGADAGLIGAGLAGWDRVRERRGS